MARVNAAFNDTAISSHHLPAALDILVEETQSFGVALFPVVGTPAPALHTASMGEVAVSFGREGWYQRDPRIKALSAVKRRGVGTDLDFTTVEAIERDPYYQDFWARFGLRWFASVGMMFGDTIWSLSLQRSIEQGPFTPHEQGALGQLSKTLSSVGAMMHALDHAAIGGAMAAFEASRRPIVLIGRWGNVVGVNQSAETLLGADLQVSEHVLKSFDPAQTGRLHDALREVIWQDVPRAEASFVRLTRRDGTPLHAHITKANLATSEVFKQCWAMITFIDPHQRHEGNAEMLRLLHGLTPAESRLALMLQHGSALDDASIVIGISRETARKQLASIFDKLGVRRQQDLIAILTSLSDRTLQPPERP